MRHPRAILESHGLRPKRSLGQNFLFDENILGKIVDAASVTESDTVLEIGAGLGHLTMLLGERAGKVIALELDEKLLPVLESVLGLYPNVRVMHADVLEGGWAEQVEAGQYKVVANVPYYITGAILRHFLEHEKKPSLMVLTVQKEVAERLAAEPGDMSLLAASVRYYGQVENVETIKAGSFWPRPDVDSAIIRIDMANSREWGIADEQFFRVVKMGFAQKRKQLQKNLRGLGLSKQELEAAFRAANIEGRRRAQSLSVAEWVGLVKALPFSGT